MAFRYFDNWESTGPIAVKDGIRSQTRGKFASSWWGKRWLETLESFGWDSRLQRGRSYARRGQVTDLKLGAGEITAGVQGSRPKPYRVSIRLASLSGEQWEEALSALEGRPLSIGQLLAGEMPPDVEEAFAHAGASLFPESAGALKMSCSCPDWAVPCKHLAAVYYLIAEWLDRDPFLLFELRGREREAVLEALRGRTEPVTVEPPQPLDPVNFWNARDLPPPPRELRPPVPMAILRALGDPPGWSGTSLMTALRPVYAAVTAGALELLEPPDLQAEPTDDPETGAETGESTPQA